LNVSFLNLHNTHIVNEIIQKHSFQNTIHEATRIATHTNTLIDPVLVSDNMRGEVMESGTIDVEQTLSDHKGTVHTFVIDQVLYKTNRMNVKFGCMKMQILKN
jgi:hypothetical protein